MKARYAIKISCGPEISVICARRGCFSVAMHSAGEKLRQKTGVFVGEEGVGKDEGAGGSSIFHGFDAVPDLDCLSLHEPRVVE